MNEIQIIQNQLATERAHFTEVANACAAALSQNNFAPGSDFAVACAEYFAFAATRVASSPVAPPASAAPQRWQEFLRAFNTTAAAHYAAIEGLLSQNLAVTEWRARSGIDADSIFTERTRYARVQATAP